MASQPLLLAWQAGNSFGWGIVGLNLFRHWATGDRVQPLMATPTGNPELRGLDPEQVSRVRTAIAHSNSFAAQLAQAPPPARVSVPVIHGLGNGLDGDKGFVGPVNVGRVVLENTKIGPERERLNKYDALLCISNWNAEILRSVSSRPVHVALEAVDHNLFFPGPRSGLFPPGRFYVFAGGKVEFRKAQDLILLAFREFARRHNDAVLVTAWHSPWPQLSVGFQGKLAAPLRLRPDGRLDIARWAAENGVNPGQFIDLGPIANEMIGGVLRDMDCALQPSRAEGGTNMVAMEAMACGAPVIVANNTGMADLIRDDNCLALAQQGPVRSPDSGGVNGWGESDVDEILDKLEQLYASAELRRKVGLAGAAFMKTRTWAAHAEIHERAAFKQ